MCHSLIDADRRTHCKIVTLAAAAALSVAMLAGAASRPEAEITAANARIFTPKKVQRDVGLANLGSS